jgi:hypothetical protein
MHVSFSGTLEHKLLAASFLGKISISMHPLAFYKTVPIIFSFKGMGLAFFIGDAE